MNEQVKRSWREVPQLLKRLLWASLIGITVVLLLRLIPERFALGEEIGVLVSDIFLAYAGGFIVTFLWSHFQRVAEQKRAARLRASAIRYMAAAHNYFFDFILSEKGGSSPFDCEDYSMLSDELLNQRTKERWADLNKMFEESGMMDQWRNYLDCSLDMFHEHFETIDSLMSQFHPTFVLALNRIRRELPNRVIVGSNGVPAKGHELSGPLIQMGAIRRHIQWLREVHAQIDKESDHDIDGAIPRFTKEELIARGVPKAMLDMMEKGEL